MRNAIVLSALFILGVAVGAPAASLFAPAPVAPAARSFHVGALELTALHDGQIIVPNNGKVFGLGVSTGAVANVLRAAGAPADHITLSVNSLLVRTGGRLILIDTGLGPRAHSQLLASLKLAGVAPGDITDVLITHPHPDHIGGLLNAEGRFAFPNATVRMASAAWDWMRQKAPPAMVPPALVKAVASHVLTFEPGARVVPGIVSVSLPGHAPGHVGFEITSGHSRLFDIGDLVHSIIISLTRPQWKNGFDNNPVLARRTRLKTLMALAKSHEWVFAHHLPFPAVGHIVSAKRGYAWDPGLP